MTIARIYQPVELNLNQYFSLTTQAIQHVVKVLRYKLNDEFIVFNGEGGEYTAKINQINKHEVIARVIDFHDVTAESCLNLHLGQAVSRGEKMDFTVQKAVELGVKEITPIITERCGIKLSSERWDKKWEHWQSIIIAACEQSGRNQIPIIHKPCLLNNWLHKIQADLKLLLHPHLAVGCKSLTVQIKNIALLVGSEGGFTEHEVVLSKQYQFTGLKLGPRILRTETAALAAVAVLQTLWGDFS